jgi:Flp pilus assembly protein TadG
MIRALRPDREAGNAALELVILAPALIFLIALIIAAGRVSTAENSISSAAADAARQASLQVNPSAAVPAGQDSADAALAADGLHCSLLTVDVDPFAVNGGFRAEVGQPAAVTATVTCDVSFAQIIAPGLPGSETLQAKATSPLDPFRER